MLSERTGAAFSSSGVYMLDAMPAHVKNGCVYFSKYEERQWMKGLAYSHRRNLKYLKRLGCKILVKQNVPLPSGGTSNDFPLKFRLHLDRRKSIILCKLSESIPDCSGSAEPVPLSEEHELLTNTRSPEGSFRERVSSASSGQISANADNMQISDSDRSNSDSQVGFWEEDDFRKGISSFIRILGGSSISDENISSTIPLESSRDRKRLDDPVSRILRLLDGTGPSPFESKRRELRDLLHKLEADFFQFAGLLGTYICIITGTGAILATGLQLSGGDVHQQSILWFCWLAGIILGSMIGSNQVLESQANAGPRNVVITGSTRGLGKALAREFLRAGDNVVVASRSGDSVRAAVTELQEELKNQNGRMQLKEEDGDFWFVRAEKGKLKVVGTTCDVSNSEQVQVLGSLAVRELGSIDIWINNAGMNKGFRPFINFSNEEIEQIISTNLIGSMICTREAIRIMKSQPKKGHIFNMDGAGSDGASTPLTAVYGASKSGLRQFHASLLKECKRSRVGIHTASPGMVLTDLLLSGSSLQNKKVFNFICEQPETVARVLVPKMRAIKGTGLAINYLTPPRLIFAIITAWLRRGRWFDDEGRAVYAAEADRLRMWAEERQRSDVTAAMEMIPSSAWVSLFSSTIICAYIIISSSSSTMPGT